MKPLSKQTSTFQFYYPPSTNFERIPPPGGLSYSPQRLCSFSKMGTELVDEMLTQAPAYHTQFNKYLSLDKQREILQQGFDISKKNWLREKTRKGNSTLSQELEKISKEETLAKGKTLGKPFFEKNWTWKSLVPLSYRRTLAPRITTSGGTLHAMKKEMSREVLTLASKNIPSPTTFIDIDLSACHAHVAASIQGKYKSLLTQAVVNSSHFWDEYATKYTQRLQKGGVNIEFSAVRQLLKISFYTSLNGGNPLNPVRLAQNLEIVAPTLLSPYRSIPEFGKSVLFSKFKSILSDLQIIAEVKELNKACVIKGRSYTLDRTNPYYTDADYKGISRVLQGVEVVLLAILTGFVRNQGGIPINLAHDGALVMFPGKQDPHKICQKLSSDIEDWSVFLLKGLKIKVEPKFWIIDGKYYKNN